MIRWLVVMPVVATALGLHALPLAAQAELDAAVERARQAWLEHDVNGLVSLSDNTVLRLHLPGVARAASLRPGQAEKLLRQYLKHSEEREFTLLELRQLAPDHAYAEVSRRYVVEGTTEERAETAFFGFRLLSGRWQLREVRITP